MNFVEAARKAKATGKRFRKVGGPWWDCISTTPGITTFQVKADVSPPGKKPEIKIYTPELHLEDFDLDTWEVESEGKMDHILEADIQAILKMPLKSQGLIAVKIIGNLLSNTHAPQEQEPDYCGDGRGN